MCLLSKPWSVYIVCCCVRVEQCVASIRNATIQSQVLSWVGVSKDQLFLDRSRGLDFDPRAYRHCQFFRDCEIVRPHAAAQPPPFEMRMSRHSEYWHSCSSERRCIIKRRKHSNGGLACVRVGLLFSCAPLLLYKGRVVACLNLLNPVELLGWSTTVSSFIDNSPQLLAAPPNVSTR